MQPADIGPCVQYHPGRAWSAVFVATACPTPGVAALQQGPYQEIQATWAWLLPLPGTSGQLLPLTTGGNCCECTQFRTPIGTVIWSCECAWIGQYRCHYQTRKSWFPGQKIKFGTLYVCSAHLLCVRGFVRLNTMAFEPLSRCLTGCGDNLLMHVMRWLSRFGRYVAIICMAIDCHGR